MDQSILCSVHNITEIRPRTGLMERRALSSVVVWRMCGAYVLYVWCMCGACVVHVWCMCGACEVQVWGRCGVVLCGRVVWCLWCGMRKMHQADYPNNWGFWKVLKPMELAIHEHATPQCVELMDKKLDGSEPLEFDKLLHLSKSKSFAMSCSRSCSRSCNLYVAVGNLLTVTIHLQDTTRTLAFHESQSC